MNLLIHIKLSSVIGIKKNMRFSMTTLSIVLPDDLAKASQAAAQELGVSRTQFIRNAIAHELENFQARLEEEAMVKSFIAMKDNKNYLAEAEEITEGLNSILPEDKERWWIKKKS
jgi:metal-responsive CopG/Arc/MetJ family transcriptional regulator